MRTANNQYFESKSLKNDEKFECLQNTQETEAEEAIPTKKFKINADDCKTENCRTNNMKSLKKLNDDKLPCNSVDNYSTEKCTKDLCQHIQYNINAESNAINQSVNVIDLNNQNIIKMFFEKILDYPLNFPKIQKTINFTNDNNYQLVSESAFASLSEHNWLNDEIINIFFLIIQDIGITQNLSILCFSSLSVSKSIKDGVLAESFVNWGRNIKVNDHELLLIPLNIDKIHWTLLLVIPSLKSFVYLDSLHEDCPKDVLNCILSFLQVTCGYEFQQDDWTIYNPKDILRQNDGKNCGVHVCTWGFKIVTGNNYLFTNNDMNDLRKSIANLIVYTDTITTHGRKRARAKHFNNEIIDLSKKIKESTEPPGSFENTSMFINNLNFLVSKNMRRTKRN